MIALDKVAHVERREGILIADAIYGGISCAIRHQLKRVLEIIYERRDCFPVIHRFSSLELSISKLGGFYIKKSTLI